MAPELTRLAAVSAPDPATKQQRSAEPLPLRDLHGNTHSSTTNGDGPEYDDWEELRDLEMEDFSPNSQVETGMARVVRICPSGSASIVNIRRGDNTSQRLLGLVSLSSVRDVCTLPDLSSAQAVLAPCRERIRQEDVEAVVEIVAKQPKKIEPVRIGPGNMGLRRALKKRISIQGLQGGGLMGFARFVGF